MVAACPYPARRGTPIRIHRLAEAMAARGHRVHVVTESQHDWDRSAELAEGVYHRVIRGRATPE